ncbi:MAG TPA: hypothetical protein VHI11_10300 [Jiangellaceae bacterium]|nr:hypothetical protein [Jiangellaceae bacterium]
MRAENLPAGVGGFRAVTFAQSFHWMDQMLVARRVRDMLSPDGAWVHVGATTHRGVPADDRPPWDRIDEPIAGYLGPVRRAGRRLLPGGTRSGEENVMRAAGFTGPTRVEVGGGQIVDRGVDAIVSTVFSLSNSAPHLFADDLSAFEVDLRRLLTQSSHDGRFCERTREIAVVVWRL